MRLPALRHAIIAVMAVCATAHAGDLDCGTAKNVQGEVLVERAGASIPLRSGDALRALDRIVVKGTGSAGITLRDETLISLGPNSTLVIDGFAFDAKTNEGSVDTSLVRGAMRYVTGLIGRMNPKSIRVSTPTAIIGIRGTEFIVEAGSEDRVSDGHPHAWHSWP
jgi:hypothetical protein